MDMNARYVETGFHRMALGALFGYCALHLLVRFLLSPTLGWDDAEQALWSQRLALGYSFRQPPLYTWLAWLFSQALGPGLLALTLLRYCVMAASLYCLYRAARLTFAQRERVVLTLASYGLFYVLAAYAHHDLTHTAIMALALSASYWAALAILRRPSWPNCLALGFCAGFGLLTKHNFALFLAGLLLAGLSMRPVRPLLLSWRAAACLGLAAVIVAPYGWWVWTNEHSFAALGQEVMGRESSLPFDAIRALADLVLALLEFTAPFILATALLFPELFRPNAPAVESPVARSLTGRAMAVAAGLTALSVFVVGAADFKGRWMHPVLMFAPFYLFAGPLRQDRLPRRLRWFVGAAIAFGVLVLAARFAVDWLEPRNSDTCRRTTPFHALADPVRNLGFAGGVLIAETNWIAGNLAALFPEARVYSLNDASAAPAPAANAPRLFVWVEGKEHQPSRILAAATEQNGADSNGLAPTRFVVAPFPRFPERQARFGLLVVPAAMSPPP